MERKLFPAVTAAFGEPPAINVRLADPPGAAKNSSESGTAPPICTVTPMVCGSSIAFGSLTVTKPVYVPLARAEVCSAICTGIHRLKAQGRAAPKLGASQETEEATLRLSEPSPLLAASTVMGFPFEPCAMDVVKAV